MIEELEGAIKSSCRLLTWVHTEAKCASWVLGPKSWKKCYKQIIASWDLWLRSSSDLIAFFYCSGILFDFWSQKNNEILLRYFIRTKLRSSEGLNLATNKIKTKQNNSKKYRKKIVASWLWRPLRFKTFNLMGLLWNAWVHFDTLSSRK